MSLREIIDGARAEAEEAAAQRAPKKKDDSAAEETTERGSQTSYARKSAANARPTRALAGSVRSGSDKDDRELTKEERKAKREERRRKEDVAYDATKVVLNQQPGYRQTQRIWWGAMIVGIVCTVGSWLIMRYLESSGQQTTSLAYLSIALMVLAYALIIGAFIYDLVKVRPMRKKAEQVMGGMSQKKMKRILADEEQRKSEAKASK